MFVVAEWLQAYGEISCRDNYVPLLLALVSLDDHL